LEEIKLEMACGAGDKAVATPTEPGCKEATPSEIE